MSTIFMLFRSFCNYNMNHFSKQLYLLWFANEHVNFRQSELLSVLSLNKINIDWVIKLDTDPFCVVKFDNDEDAKKVGSRCVTLRSIYKLWSYGTTSKELHDKLKAIPKEIMEEYFQPHLSFKLKVETFCKTYTMQEKVDKIEMFNYLPIKGPVRLSNPDINLHYIEYYGLHPNKAPPDPYYLFFGLWLCDGQRDAISKLSLKERKFIGNTSMDPQLSLIMANTAMVQPGDMVMDPFVGTGSLLVAAAYFGAYVLGTDIDFLMLHGKSRPTRIQSRMRPRDKDESVYSNVEQYGRGSQYLDVVVGDSSLQLWHPRLIVDAIITDPPYGIREATERIGTAKDYKISDEHLLTHIPSKVEYDLQQIYKDLLHFSVRHLKLGGRLVSWLPTTKVDYCESKLPQHPCLQLVSNCEQVLSGHTSRRCLTYKKISQPNSEDNCSIVPQMFPSRFRERHFGEGETRKQRKARIAQELKEQGIVYIPKSSKNSNGKL